MAYRWKDHELLEISFKELIMNEVLPKFNPLRKKYSNGMCAFIGSSEVYTGGLYIAAISAMKAGADQSHIFGHSSSITALKSYNPEIIVHDSFSSVIDKNKIIKESKWLKNMSTVNIGTCIGKEEYVPELLDLFMSESSKIKGLIHIIDADALYYFTSAELGTRQKLLNTLKSSICVFTPNHKEFKYLFSTIISLDSTYQLTPEEELIFEEAEYEYYKEYSESKPIAVYENSSLDKSLFFYREIVTAKSIGHIILRKGMVDIITDGTITYLVCNPSSHKRCGGIGDVLVGAASAFTSMHKNTKEQINEKSLLGAIAASTYYVKYLSKLTFEKYGVSMTSCDIVGMFNLAPINTLV